jgi:hypothetical protein
MGCRKLTYLSAKRQNETTENTGLKVVYRAKNLGQGFLSRDPWESKYAWQTPYAYYANSPIAYIDWNGYGDPDDEENTNYVAPSGNTIAVPSSATPDFENKTNVKIPEGSLVGFTTEDGEYYGAQYSKSEDGKVMFTGYFTKKTGLFGGEYDYQYEESSATTSARELALVNGALTVTIETAEGIMVARMISAIATPIAIALYIPGDTRIKGYTGVGYVGGNPNYPGPWTTDKPNNYVPKPAPKPGMQNAPKGALPALEAILFYKLYKNYKKTYKGPVQMMPADNTYYYRPAPPPIFRK